MMIERIISRISTLSPSGYKVLEREESSAELFLAGKQRELARAKDVNRYTVTLYKDFSFEGEDYKGEASVKIPAGAGDEEIDALLRGAYTKTSYVKNKPYVLAGGGVVLPDYQASAAMTDPVIDKRELFQLVNQTAGGIERVFTGGSVSLAAAEITICAYKQRLVNSEGLDKSFNGAKGYIETIAVSRSGPGEETEVYRKRDFSDFSPDFLLPFLEDQKRICFERAEAKPLPAGLACPLILRPQESKALFEYYVNQTSAQSLFEQISSYTLGLDVLGADRDDALSLGLVNRIPGSVDNAPFDLDGVPLAPVKLIDRGKIIAFWGTLQYAQYMGIPVTGLIGNIEVSGGMKTEEELREKPHLEAVIFSDFMMNGQTGDFGGELRLGYLWDGISRTPVFGGSVSGNLADQGAGIICSKERIAEENGLIPKVVCLPNPLIAGG